MALAPLGLRIGLGFPDPGPPDPRLAYGKSRHMPLGHPGSKSLLDVEFQGTPGQGLQGRTATGNKTKPYKKLVKQQQIYKYVICIYSCTNLIYLESLYNHICI